MRVNSNPIIEMEMDNEETYTANVKCCNCGSERYFHNIPKGTTVEIHLDGTNCPMCLCPITKKGRPRW